MTKAKKPKQSGTEQVNEFMTGLEHPLKAEVQAVREIIMGVHSGITEDIKWSAPTFSYKGYILTFHLRATQHVHLIFHNAAILPIESDLLEGEYVDRRMTYFKSMAEIEANKAELERIIQAWVDLMDAQSVSSAGGLE
jgi:hypothetical protein